MDMMLRLDANLGLPSSTNGFLVGLPEPWLACSNTVNQIFADPPRILRSGHTHSPQLAQAAETLTMCPSPCVRDPCPGSIDELD